LRRPDGFHHFPYTIDLWTLSISDHTILRSFRDIGRLSSSTRLHQQKYIASTDLPPRPCTVARCIPKHVKLRRLLVLLEAEAGSSARRRSFSLVWCQGAAELRNSGVLPGTLTGSTKFSCRSRKVWLVSEGICKRSRRENNNRRVRPNLRFTMRSSALCADPDMVIHR
jgi:hypothetical protein